MNARKLIERTFPREKAFAMMLYQAGLPAPHLEYRFAAPRLWRFDYCWPEKGVALEVEGGVWRRGRHTRGSGFVKDMEKYNAAARLGYRLLRVVPQDLCSTETIELLRSTLNGDSP